MTGRDVVHTYCEFRWLLDCDRAIARHYDRGYFPGMPADRRSVPPAPTRPTPTRRPAIRKDRRP